MSQYLFRTIALVLIAAGFTTTAIAQESKTKDDDSKPAPTQKVVVADGALHFKAPKSWKKTQPKVNFIEAEFKIVRADGDENDGRMTIMGAGGSVDANIQRWIGQFEQPDGSDTKSKTKIKELVVDECDVHLVDITGNFMEGSGGPFAPKTEREGYRMLAAIIETPDNGNYFVKLYGPAKTMKKNMKGFHQLIKSLKIED